MKEKILNILLPITWILILIFCCFLYSTTSHASGLPYYVDSDNFDFHGMSSQDVEDYINQNIQVSWDFDFETYPTLFYTFESNNNDYLVIFTGYPSNSPSTYTFNLNNVPYGTFDTDINYATLTYSNICKIQLRYPYSVNYVYDWDWWPYQTQNLTLFGNYYYPEYISTNFKMGSGDYDENSNPYVLVNAFENPIDIGVAIIPNFNDPGLDITTSYPNPPNLVTPSNPPTFDPSNIPQSTYNLIEWGLKDPNGPFHCLETNLSNFFEYIGDCIEALGKSIIQNIQNAINNLYENFKSLIEPIYNKIDYISQPVSGTVIYDNISGTTLIQSINTVDGALTTFQGTFNGLSEPNSFVIPIHLENLPSSWFGTQTTQYLDLSWINSDMRTLIRGFMWAIITYALFITIVDSIANYINGGGDES